MIVYYLGAVLSESTATSSKSHLASAFRDANDAVTLSLKRGVDLFRQLLKSELNFWDQADVHDAACHTCLHCNKSRLPTHQVDEPQTPERGTGFHLSSQQRSLRLVNRGFESEALVDEEDVIVDGFRNTNNRTHYTATNALFVDSIGSCVASVTADDINHVKTPEVDAMDNLFDVCTPSGCSKKGSPPQVDSLHCSARQRDRFYGARIEAPQSIPAPR